MHWLPHDTASIQGTYVICSSKGIQWCWGMYLLRGKIKRLVVAWTSTWVEFCHRYDDFDRFNIFSGHLELQSSLYLAVQTRHILQTVRVTSRNGRYIWVSETSTRSLDQKLWILQPSMLRFFPFLQNITLTNMRNQAPWWNDKSTIVRFQGWSSSLFLILSTRFSTLDSLCFVRMVRCGNVIMSSVHGLLTTLRTFNCTQSSSLTALCAKHQYHSLENRIHRRGDSKTISLISKRW